MTYATQADLVERFGADEVRQLTDRHMPAQGAIVAAVLDRAIADAAGLIDAHLAGRYVLPLSTPHPAQLVRVACDITRYFLHDLSAPDLVREHYEDAVKWLRDVAAGKVPLIGATGLEVQASAQPSGAAVARPYAADAAFGDDFSTRYAP